MLFIQIFNDSQVRAKTILARFDNRYYYIVSCTPVELCIHICLDISNGLISCSEKSLKIIHSLLLD